MNSPLKSVLDTLLNIFLWPGDFVRQRLGIELERDGGIIRSFVNMIVWGAIILFVGLRFGS